MGSAAVQFNLLILMMMMMVMMVIDDDDGFPANSPHDKIPPWWEYVINR